MENKLNVSFLNTENNEITVREGQALPPKEPVKVNIVGTIYSVTEYLTQRDIDVSKCHVIIDRAEMYIKLVVNEKWHYQDTITGKITMNPEFTKWGINNENAMYSSLDLAKKIKMNRYQFASLEKATELVTVFQNLKAKVQREVEASDSNKGSYKRSVVQVVNEMSIPERFDIITPIFKGDDKRTLSVEIVIDPESLNCSLISPEAIDIVARERDRLIDSEKDGIIALCPNIPIFEV